ncbi:oxidoreductase [Selaginella moellendorffii]|uniref:2-oxoacid-dependent dioxygenase n=1 Tax=Selaginella moellendorffii TaxID=88036 RepID=D8R9U3_SELML|nr:probable 2-oxoglutarate-dependent dioxygenase ANS [Selaginella moellendorffii]EFJ31214.1 2-oxoacid-dependent dioxygenase [Selaginella moellendorffii]EFJ31215.1 oxidoreductase [Selaginella moellendorffii]|eukprot:XP_020440925.1 probable 2-oxoglutarate-dependent dioxygenase ANS [Selaginella moellendorffii]
MALQVTAAASSTVSSAPLAFIPARPSTSKAAMDLPSSSSKVFPESHRWPPSDCPKVFHNQYIRGLELPVIDLDEDERVCLEKLRKACEEWGFFNVVSHGVPQDLMKSMEGLSKSFFGLPVESKIQATEGSWKFRLYESFSRKKYTACSWVEGLNVHDLSAIPQIASCAWPEQSTTISKTFTDYLREMDKLGKRILRLLVLSLGVKESTASDLLSGCGFTGTRFNYYPSCPEPSMALGLVPHTDPNCVTILHQDSVGGLQIARKGQWIAVKPIDNAIVINIGDSFQAWSNCRYKSVEHRAVVNSDTPRVSIGYFYGPVAEDLVIQAPSELVDGDHPPVHRPFRYMDYMSWRTTSNLFGKNAFNVFTSLDFPGAAAAASEKP